MKNYILIFFTLTLMFFGCSKRRNYRHNPQVIEPNYSDSYVPVAKAVISFSRNEQVAFIKFLNKINPISTAYAATASTTVTYTSTEVGTFTLDVSALIPNENGDTLELGSVTISALKINKLKVCGPGNNQKCTTAVIRAYTQELSGFPGISGFVNIDDSYGADVYGGKTTADQLVGLGVAGNTILQSYSISANDNKLSLSDFPSPTYVLESDFSNAGAGDYSMVLILEVALGI